MALPPRSGSPYLKDSYWNKTQGGRFRPQSLFQQGFNWRNNPLLNKTHHSRRNINTMFEQYLRGELVEVPEGATDNDLKAVWSSIKLHLFNTEKLLTINTDDPTGIERMGIDVPIASLEGGWKFAKWESPFITARPSFYDTAEGIALAESAYGKKYSWAKNSEINTSDSLGMTQELTTSVPSESIEEDTRPSYVNSGSALFRKMNRGY